MIKWQILITTQKKQIIEYSEYVAEEVNKMRLYNEYISNQSFSLQEKPKMKLYFWSDLKIEAKISTIIGVIGIILSFIMLIK